MRIRASAVGIAVMAGLTGACAYLRPARVPMSAVQFAPPRDGGQCLVLFLPGRANTPPAFAKEGFIRLAEQAGVRAALVGADAHLRYYMKEQVLVRLDEDIIGPARAAGVTRVVLVGVSLGGLGALLYARDHPGEIDGIVLLAPFLGYKDMIAEVQRAGGLASWTPPARIARRDFEHAVWQFLKQTGTPGGPVPPLILAHGTRDTFERAHALLAEALPGERVLTVDGGHDWRTWRALWQQVLASGAVQRWCAGGEQ